MNKKLIILTALMLVTSYQGLVVLDASAGPGDFTTMWVINLPRATYFIGESVTFTVVAFASSDPSILLPDQMAKITIRNSSMAQVYEAWVTTNVNGSAPVTWESGLDAYAGNYTIILDDLSGKKVIAEFMLLYNEETFWQTKVDMVERELQSQYNYINYLFSYQKYQEKRIRWMSQQFKLLWAMSFLTVMCGAYVFMHEASGSRRSTSGLSSLPGKGFELLGFRSRPIVELDHEEIANLEVPASKSPPIYGHTFFCTACDPDGKKLMTKNELRDHILGVHEPIHMKKISIRAKLGERRARRKAKALQEPEKPMIPKDASMEEYRKEWVEETSKEHFQARLASIKKQLKKGKITQAEARARISQLREDLRKANATRATTEVLKQTPSPKLELQRKVRTERHISSTPKSHLKTDDETCPECEALGATELSEKGRTRLESAVVSASRSTPKTAIDELFDKLSNEKVN